MHISYIYHIYTAVRAPGARCPRGWPRRSRPAAPRDRCFIIITKIITIIIKNILINVSITNVVTIICIIIIMFIIVIIIIINMFIYKHTNGLLLVLSCVCIYV